MAKPKDPEARVRLIEEAARMLREREPITLRSLVAGTGTSTMAVYTHFGGIDGLWRALRQEGFVRLAARFAELPASEDPVADLAALCAAYVANALDHPDLYRVMFDASVELEDLPAADATLEHLDRAVERGQRDGRVNADLVPRDVAVQSWVVVHGVTSLVANGPLPPKTLAHAPELLGALLVRCGDEPDRAEASVRLGWARTGSLLPE